MADTAAVQQVSPQAQFQMQQEMWKANIENVRQQVVNAHHEALAKDAVSVMNDCLFAFLILAAVYLIRRAIAASVVKNESDNQRLILEAKYDYEQNGDASEQA